jgi:hypothetical protein
MSSKDIKKMLAEFSKRSKAMADQLLEFSEFIDDLLSYDKCSEKSFSPVYKPGDVKGYRLGRAMVEVVRVLNNNGGAAMYSGEIIHAAKLRSFGILTRRVWRVMSSKYFPIVGIGLRNNSQKYIVKDETNPIFQRLLVLTDNYPYSAPDSPF